MYSFHNLYPQRRGILNLTSILPACTFRNLPSKLNKFNTFFILVFIRKHVNPRWNHWIRLKIQCGRDENISRSRVAKNSPKVLNRNCKATKNGHEYKERTKGEKYMGVRTRY